MRKFRVVTLEIKINMIQASHENEATKLQKTNLLESRGNLEITIADNTETLNILYVKENTVEGMQRVSE